MSMSRDRLIREEDLTEVYLRNIRRGTVLDSFTPFRWGTTPLTETTDRATMGLASGVRTGVQGVSGRGIQGRTGRHNMSPANGRPLGRARGSSSLLPSWYPRRPLQDITYIVRVMEARRAREREVDGLQLESPVVQDQSVPEEDETEASTSDAQLEHDMSMYTPAPTRPKRRTPLTARKLPKLLLDISQDNTGDQAFLTPQRKLLNSIEAVEKVMREELQEWRSSPAAKKAERREKVRTLMSMR